MLPDKRKLLSNPNLGYLIQEFNKEVDVRRMNQQEIAVAFEKWRDKKLKLEYDCTILKVKDEEGKIWTYNGEEDTYFSECGHFGRSTITGLEIVQIQRKDNIIFEIGNLIRYYSRFMIIIGFQIQENNILMITKYDSFESSPGEKTLAISSQAFKIDRSNVILISKDDKEVYGGDIVWIINENSNFSNNAQRILPGYIEKAHLLYFKEKENAQAYIFSKKKRFSIDDLWSQRELNSRETIKQFIESLVQVAKEKTNA